MAGRPDAAQDRRVRRAARRHRSARSAPPHLPNWLSEQIYLLRAAIDLVRERLGTPRRQGDTRAVAIARARARVLERATDRRKVLILAVPPNDSGACTMGSNAMPDVRPAAVAGMFYPEAPSALAARGARASRGGRGAAANAPPAPPRRSSCRMPATSIRGRSPPSAYARLAAGRGTIRRVVLFGPTHRVPVRGLALPSVRAFATPLGEVAVDRAAADLALTLPQVATSDAAHALEHSLEVQLPFLQAVLGDFTHRAVRRRRRDGGRGRRSHRICCGAGRRR